MLDPTDRTIAMLAYVFWHRPRVDVALADYEAAQVAFHRVLDVTSACFRLTELPFTEDFGYEDWYLVEDWGGLGRLNEVAVDSVRRGDHDRAAGMALDGWGAVYRLERGAAEIPVGVEWCDKPRGEDAGESSIGRRLPGFGGGSSCSVPRPSSAW
jgi:hypothetical protein